MRIIERGPLDDPQYLKLTPNDGDHWHTWVADEANATRFADDEAAGLVAADTGADELRVTELEDEG